MRFIRWQIGQKLQPYPVVYNLVENSQLVVERGMHGATGNIYVGLLEFPEMSFVLHCLTDKDLFGDIGANVGAFSIIASVNAGANTISVEPIPDTYKKMVRNVKINNAEDKIKTLQVGVGDKNTTLRFTENLDTINGVALNQDNDVNTVEVQVLRLDDIFKEQKPVLLKIDVEGYEWQVLQGSKDILNDDTLKAVIIEINGSGNAYGKTDDDIHKLLLSHNFLPYTYNPFDRSFAKLATHGVDNTIYIRDLEWASKRVTRSRHYNILGLQV